MSELKMILKIGNILKPHFDEDDSKKLLKILNSKNRIIKRKNLNSFITKPSI